jgi:anti-sigma B factor antagonist
MISVDLSTRECDGQVIVALRGVLDVADAASAAVALTAAAARHRDIIIDLAGLEFIDSSGVAALVRGRRQARHAGGELLLAAPQPQVLRVLTLTRLIDVFTVHASVAEAAGSAGHPPRGVCRCYSGGTSKPSGPPPGSQEREIRGGERGDRRELGEGARA